MIGRLVGFGLLALMLTACSSPADPIVGAAEAAKVRDKETYLQHFTPRSQDLLGLIWSGSHSHWTELSVGNIEIIETSPMPPSLKGTQRARVLFTEHGKQYEVVVHASGGEWLIDLVDSEGAALTQLGNQL